VRGVERAPSAEEANTPGSSCRTKLCRDIQIGIGEEPSRENIEEDNMDSKRLTVLSENLTLSSLLGVVLQIILLILAQRPVQAQVESKEYGATRVDFAVPGGSGFVIKPDHSEPAGLKPWVWYAPTFVKATPKMGRYPNKSLTWFFTRLLDKGVWIAGVDVGESYGNAQGRKAYTQFYKIVAAALPACPESRRFDALQLGRGTRA
jgi:hypothetical protein